MAMPAAQAQGPDEFELARRRAQQQVTAATQAKTDAIKRRMSAAGALNSGAAIKQEQIAHDEGQQQLQQATEQVDAAERAEFRRRREVQEGRDFARSEREASQQFASGETALARRFQEQMQGKQFDFTRGEREAGQTFQAGQLEKQMGQQAEQFKADLDSRMKIAADQIAAQERQGQLTREQAAKALEETRRQFDAELRENIKTNVVNTIISAHNSKMSPDQMKGLLGGLNLEGLGLDLASLLNAAPAAPQPPAIPGVPTQPQFGAPIPNGNWNYNAGNPNPYG